MDREEKNTRRFCEYEEVPLFLSCPDIMRLLGLSRATVYSLLKAKNFPTITAGSHLIVRKDELFQWIESHERVIDENAPVSEPVVFRK